MTTAETMAKMFEIRDERRALGARDSALVEEWAALEAQLLTQLDEQGAVKVSSKDGTAIATQTDLPQVDDWDAVAEWIYANQALHMLQRRPATGAFRELWESGESIPGVRKVVKRTISLRSA